jgi:hypothetical protein
VEFKITYAIVVEVEVIIPVERKPSVKRCVNDLSFGRLA